MNIETREIRSIEELTDEEKKSGKWIPVAKKYVKKQPITDADFARILKANERRLRRLARRADFAGTGTPLPTGTGGRDDG